MVRQVGPSIPILGVCLGHQCIGAAYGGEILRAGAPMHGKTSRIHHTGRGTLSRAAEPVHRHPVSLPGDRAASLPPSLEVTATSEDGEIMAVQHVEHPVYGVQFHPESVLTEHGYRLLDHFLHGVPATPRSLPDAADGALLPDRADESTLASAPPPVGSGSVILETIVTSLDPAGADQLCSHGSRVGR